MTAACCAACADTREAREQVVSFLRTKNPLVPIRSELADVNVETIEGVPSPVVQRARAGDGLKLSLIVRPLGAEGPFYIAGQGGRSVLVAVDGRPARGVCGRSATRLRFRSVFRPAARSALSGNLIVSYGEYERDENQESAMSRPLTQSLACRCGGFSRPALRPAKGAPRAA